MSIGSIVVSPDSIGSVVSIGVVVCGEVGGVEPAAGSVEINEAVEVDEFDLISKRSELVGIGILCGD